MPKGRLHRMHTSTAAPEALFGANVVAMVTPMQPGGDICELGLSQLVEHVITTGCDGIVVGGTSGEAPTLTDHELIDLVSAVTARVRGRARVIAGVGSNDTASTVARARRAEAAGADALLLVCPYYSRPTQPGIIAHCGDVADSTELPVMLYDVPIRAGTAMSASTLVELSEHPKICAVKDAKGDLFEAMSVMAASSLAYYCGIDELNLPYLASGATGVVSVVGNIAADRNSQLIHAVRRADLATARSIQAELLPLTDAIMRTGPGAITAKIALQAMGVIEHSMTRRPLVESPGERERVHTGLTHAKVPTADLATL